MSIWCSYVGGPSAVPIRWAVFFRNNTHFGMFVLWGSLRQMVLAFEKVLWMVPPNCSVHLSPGLWGAQIISAQLFLYIVPQSPMVLWCASCLFEWSFACLLNCHLHLFTSFSSRGCGCLTFCYHCFQLSPQLSWIYLPIFAVLCSAVFRRCPERQVRSSKHIQKCSLEGVPNCHLLNLRSIWFSRKISWKVPGTFFWRVLSIVINVSLQNGHTQRKQYTHTPPLCKTPIIMVFFGLISAVKFWVPFQSIFFSCFRPWTANSPTSLGALWPVTPGKASATRVVQKWISAPDPPVKLKEAPP